MILKHGRRKSGRGRVAFPAGHAAASSSLDCGPEQQPSPATSRALAKSESAVQAHALPYEGAKAQSGASADLSRGRAFGHDISNAVAAPSPGQGPSPPAAAGHPLASRAAAPAGEPHHSWPRSSVTGDLMDELTHQCRDF